MDTLHPDAVRDRIMDLRLDYISRHVGVQPTRVALPPRYAKVLHDWLLDDMPRGDDRDRVEQMGLAGIYGGSLYGMTIERAADGEAPSVYGTQT